MNRKGSKMKKFVSFTSIVTLCAVLLCSFGSIEAVSYETATSGNVIPEKISTFEGVTIGETPVNSGTYDKAEWGIFRAATTSGTWRGFNSTYYTVIPRVADEEGHGHVLELQPKAYDTTPRWAIGAELYAEASKYPNADTYRIDISADVKKSDSSYMRLLFKKADGDTDYIARTDAKGANGVWTTFSLSCELTLDELKNNAGGQYFNISFIWGQAPTAPVYLDNITATVTPVYEMGEDYADGVFCPQITKENFQSKISRYYDLSGETASFALVNSQTYPSILLAPSDTKGKRIGIKPEVVSAVTGNKTGVYMLSAEINSASGDANTLYAQIGCGNNDTVVADRQNGFVGNTPYINSNVVSSAKKSVWTKVNFIFALSEDWLKDNTGIWFCQDGTKTSMYLYNITLKRIDVNFSNVSVDLGTSLSLNASVKEDFTGTVKPILGDATKLAVRFTRGGKSVEVEPNADGKFVFDNIAPQCMTENITAELLYTDRQGTKVVAQRENYSIKEYFNSLYAENSGNAKLVSLLSDALTYGAAAQNYTGFNLDNLATAGVDWVAPTDRTIPDDQKLVDGNSELNKVTAAGVYFANSNRIYFKFVKEAGAEIKLYKNGEEVEYSLQEGNKAYTPDILPTEYDAVFKFVITKDSQAVYTVEYRVNDYIARKQNSANIGALVKAMNNYGGSCKEYKQ